MGFTLKKNDLFKKIVSFYFGMTINLKSASPVIYAKLLTHPKREPKTIQKQLMDKLDLFLTQVTDR